MNWKWAHPIFLKKRFWTDSSTAVRPESLIRPYLNLSWLLIRALHKSHVRYTPRNVLRQPVVSRGCTIIKVTFKCWRNGITYGMEDTTINAAFEVFYSSKSSDLDREATPQMFSMCVYRFNFWNLKFFCSRCISNINKRNRSAVS